MLCKTCATPLNPGQKFCSECGSTLERATPVGVPPKLSSIDQAQSYRVPPLVLRKSKTSESGEVVSGSAVETASKWAVGIFVFFAFWIVVTVALTQDFTSSPSPEPPASARTAPVSPTPTFEPESWFPEKYKLLTDNVAYRKIKNSDCDISIAHSCYQIYVMANKPCKLFIRVNFLVGDVVIDDSLDSVTVIPGQRGILTFGSITAASYEGSKQVQFTDVTCY